ALSTCRTSCRETHTLPNTVSCFGHGELFGDFGSKLAGRQKMHRGLWMRELPGRAEQRQPGTIALAARFPTTLSQPPETVVGRRYMRGCRQFQPGPESQTRESEGADQMRWSNTRRGTGDRGCGVAVGESRC